ncbi:hypothetical protein DBR22_04355 [Arthrobacter sp. HMWF013]|nr:hypothetical protein DBR22_04355 [Arthrobacter sp. HMWF013]
MWFFVGELEPSHKYYTQGHVNRELGIVEALHVPVGYVGTLQTLGPRKKCRSGHDGGWMWRNGGDTYAWSKIELATKHNFVTVEFLKLITDSNVARHESFQSTLASRQSAMDRKNLRVGLEVEGAPKVLLEGVL